MLIIVRLIKLKLKFVLEKPLHDEWMKFFPDANEQLSFWTSSLPSQKSTRAKFNLSFLPVSSIVNKYTFFYHWNERNKIYRQLKWKCDWKFHFLIISPSRAWIHHTHESVFDATEKVLIWLSFLSFNFWDLEKISTIFRNNKRNKFLKSLKKKRWLTFYLATLFNLLLFYIFFVLLQCEDFRIVYW